MVAVNPALEQGQVLEAELVLEWGQAQAAV